jgi:hypothetical protein
MSLVKVNVCVRLSRFARENPGIAQPTDQDARAFGDKLPELAYGKSPIGLLPDD